MKDLDKELEKLAAKEGEDVLGFLLKRGYFRISATARMYLLSAEECASEKVICHHCRDILRYVLKELGLTRSKKYLPPLVQKLQQIEHTSKVESWGAAHYRKYGNDPKDYAKEMKKAMALQEECNCWEGCNDREGKMPCPHERLPVGGGPFENTSLSGRCRCGADGPPWKHKKGCAYT